MVTLIYLIYIYEFTIYYKLITQTRIYDVENRFPFAFQFSYDDMKQTKIQKYIYFIYIIINFISFNASTAEHVE